MPTPYTDLYPHIRAVLGDTDSSMYQYPNEALDQQIDLVVLLENDSTIAASGGSFTNNLSSNQKALVVLKSARNIIAPQPDDMAYRTPVISVFRRGQTRFLLLHIDTLLAEIEGGSIYIQSEGELTALVNAVDRFDENLTDAEE